MFSWDITETMHMHKVWGTLGNATIDPDGCIEASGDTLELPGDTDTH